MFLSSSKVKVFPSSYRGVSSTTSKYFDPESRLNTEANFAKITNRLTDVRKSFVSTWDDTGHILICTLGGYSLELNLSEVVADSAFIDAGSIYIGIKLIDRNSTGAGDTTGTEYPATSLAPFDNPSNLPLDVPSGSSYIFKGVVVDSNISGVSGATHSLLALTYSGGSGWLIAPGAQLKISASHIANEEDSADTDSIKSVFYTCQLGKSTSYIPKAYITDAYITTIQHVDTAGLKVGNTGVQSALIPDTDALRDLGTTDKKWGTMWINNVNVTTALTTGTLNVSSGVTSNLIPDTTLARDLGSNSNKWSNLYSNIAYFSDISSDTYRFNGGIYGSIVPYSTSYNLGSSGSRWGSIYSNHIISNIDISSPSITASTSISSPSITSPLVKTGEIQASTSGGTLKITPSLSTSTITDLGIFNITNSTATDVDYDDTAELGTHVGALTVSGGISTQNNLRVAGDARINGTLYVSTIVGSLAGNADTATTANSATSAGIASRLATLTAGNAYVPSYFSGGQPVACSTGVIRSGSFSNTDTTYFIICSTSDGAHPAEAWNTFTYNYNINNLNMFVPTLGGAISGFMYGSYIRVGNLLDLRLEFGVDVGTTGQGFLNDQWFKFYIKDIVNKLVSGSTFDQLKSINVTSRWWSASGSGAQYVAWINGDCAYVCADVNQGNASGFYMDLMVQVH